MLIHAHAHIHIHIAERPRDAVADSRTARERREGREMGMKVKK